MKRVWSLALCVFLLLGICPVTAASTYYENGFDYQLVNSGTGAEIVNYYGLGGDVVIPETLGGYPVVSVQDGAIECQSDTQITTLSLPSSLASFTANAMIGNYSLESISLAEGNEDFELIDGVLYQNQGKHLVLYPSADPRISFVVPGGVRIIGAAAFYSAKNLERIALPVSLLTIESAATNLPGAFENCTSLTAISIPAKTSLIGDYAFMGCTSLTKAVIPYSATDVEIGLGAFLNCTSLMEAALYPNVVKVSAEAFGYQSRINEADMMETTLVEGFSICALNGSAAGTYATGNGITYRKMRLLSDFWSDLAPKMLGDEADSSMVSGITADLVTDADSLAVIETFFSRATAYTAVEMQYTTDSSQALPEAFDSPFCYSIACPSAISNKEETYVFFLDTETQTVEYIPSFVVTGYDAFGVEVPCVVFETQRIGTFALINSVCIPGNLNSDGEISANDVSTLAKRVAGWEQSVDLLGADVNGDGDISGSDIVLLAKYLSGWDVELSYFGQFAVSEESVS